MSKKPLKSSRKKKKEEGPKEDLSGSGKFYHSDAVYYDGEWKLKKIPLGNKSEETVKIKDGKGTYTDNNNVYTGVFLDDKFHGNGEMRFITGDVYTGEFFEDKFHGKGTFIWSDESKYIGEWSNNRMHGKGIYISKNGKRFVGDFYNGVGKDLKSEIE